MRRGQLNGGRLHHQPRPAGSGQPRATGTSRTAESAASSSTWTTLILSALPVRSSSGGVWDFVVVPAVAAWQSRGGSSPAVALGLWMNAVAARRSPPRPGRGGRHGRAAAMVSLFGVDCHAVDLLLMMVLRSGARPRRSGEMCHRRAAVAEDVVCGLTNVERVPWVLLADGEHPHADGVAMREHAATVLSPGSGR